MKPLFPVKWTELGAGEVTLVEGALQILVFSVILLVARLRRQAEDEDGGCEAPAPATKHRLRKWALVALRGFLIASMSYACILAVGLMPIGDLIVLAFLSPVFSVVMDAVFLKRRLTLLSVFLCVLIGTSTKYLHSNSTLYSPACTQWRETSWWCSPPSSSPPSSRSS